MNRLTRRSFIGTAAMAAAAPVLRAVQGQNAPAGASPINVEKDVVLERAGISS